MGKADVPLEDRLRCFGYNGFGSGYALYKWGPSSDRAELYCGARCSRGQKCWTRHQARVRELFPDSTQLADEIAQTHRGTDYMLEWMRRTGQDPDHILEPYTALMMGNTEDGGCVAEGAPPKDRGHSSLTWPLHPLEEQRR